MPLFPDAVLEEIRNSVNIVSLVSEHVALRKQGHNFKARCPFHTEKSPSFNVNEEKQILHCFGCGVGGDVFKFLTLIEHISFPESVRLLAGRCGVALPDARAADDSPSSEVDYNLLRQAMTQASEFFRATLLRSEEGR